MALDRALELGQVGIQVAAYLGEELVVDTWAGVSDEASGTAVGPDTLFIGFSATKAFVMTALHMQVERGHVDYGAPVSTYWPEYASHGKDAITVEQVITHRSGVPQMPEGMTADRFASWDWIVERLAELTPLAPAGSRSLYSGYAALYVIGEVVRRTDPCQRSLAQFVADELFVPLGIEADAWIGAPERELHRIAPLTCGDDPPTAHLPTTELRRLTAPPAIAPVPDVYNRRDVQMACIPASTGIMTARAGARFFSLLANGGSVGGVRLLSEERVRAMTRTRRDPYEVDEATDTVMWIGQGGLWLGGASPPADPAVGAGDAILAVIGVAGALAWADLDTGLSVMICRNRIFGSLGRGEHPLVPVADAVREVAAERAGARRQPGR